MFRRRTKRKVLGGRSWREEETGRMLFIPKLFKGAIGGSHDFLYEVGTILLLLYTN